MTFSPNDDIRPVSDLKRNPTSIVRHIRKTRRPVFLTTRGKADVVLMDVKMFEEYFEAGQLGRMLAEGETDIAAGRVRPMREFLRELKRGKKISR